MIKTLKEEKNLKEMEETNKNWKKSINLFKKPQKNCEKNQTGEANH